MLTELRDRRENSVYLPGMRISDETEVTGNLGEALAGAGYFGPFGIDAYRYRDRAGALRLQPRSEINARYSMGFAVGLGAAQ